MDIRPQGPEIIRTWLFSTVVRSHYEHGTLPWANATLNGWILDPDRKKMSKSKGNVVTPMPLFEQYGTDAVRYWAISARPGVDTAVSEDQMKVGRRLATKLLNVTKFVLGIAGDGAGAGDASPTPSTWRCWPGSTRRSPRPRSAFEGFDYARALERTEAFFWWFCDDYVELVKGRAYGGRGDERGGVGAGRAAARPSTRCSGCSPRRCRSPPRRRGAGRTTAASTRARWPAADAAATAAASTSTPSARCWRGCAGPRPRPS